MDSEGSDGERSRIEDRRVTRPILLLGSLLFVLPLFFLSCTSIRPIAKIGLVAPFEGLYRQSGYAALDTMRATIDARENGVIDLLALAHDGHADAANTRRAVEKLLIDERVDVLVGPLSPPLAASMADLMAQSDIAWIAPYAVDPAGSFAHPAESEAWATGLVGAVGAAAKEQGAGRLLLAGSEAGWPALSDEEWSDIAGIPVERAKTPADAAAGDALFWMGGPAEGVTFLNALRELETDVPFWLGRQGDDPVFARRATGVQKVYWATWTDLAYTAWTADRSLASPSAYLIYLATNAAADSITGEETKPQSSGGSDWFVQLYAVNGDGVPVPLASR